MKSASTKMYLSTEEEMKAAEVNGIYWTLLCCLTISYSLNIIYIYIYIYIIYITAFLPHNVSSLFSYVNVFWFLNYILSYRPAVQAPHGTIFLY